MSMSSSKNQPPNTRISPSQTVTKRGVQDVLGRGQNANERALIPASTLRALQLRNGKGGAFGTGEVMRIPGREKLELIAEDEMEKAKEERRKNLYEANMNSSLKAPFQLETVLRIAQSQMDAYIDLIDALRNPDLCHDIVLREIEANCPPMNGEKDGLMHGASFVAQQFGICVHNAHMLASGWIILYESFRKLQDMGLRDRDVFGQLQTSAEIREIYFSAFELLKKLISAQQQRLRTIVQNTPHYAPYFKSSNDVGNLQEFEKSEIKRMYKSFLDSTIIELCLPGSKFSPQALYFCLHTTQEETPKLLKRCSQVMWDVVGDLAEAVRLLDIMETPLINRKSDDADEDTPTTFGEFARWDEAQAKSVKAAMEYSSFVNLVHPLTNLTIKATLDKAWDRLNKNYLRESGQTIDGLWQLADARHRIPHFSTLTIPSKGAKKALVRKGQNGKKKSKRAVVEEEEDNSDWSHSSMPGLKALSDSEYEFGEPDSDDDYSSDSEEEEYDEEAEEELKRQQREAIDRAVEDPEVLDLNNEKYKDERKKNPLLSLLGNLRGRLFSSSSILRTDGQTTVTSKPSMTSTTRRSIPRPSAIPKASGDKAPAKAAPPQTTTEDAEDESDDLRPEALKKKKPKKKKKKKTGSASVDAQSPTSEVPASPVPEPPPRSASPEPLASPVLPSSPISERQQRSTGSPSVKSQSTKSSLPGITTIASSTTTLPLPYEEKAPSAHSYLKELTETKAKVKTRGETTADAPPEEKGRRNLFDRLRGKNRDVPEKVEKQENDVSFFGRLKRKTLRYLRKLIGVSAQDRKGSLKWEQFVQVMRELGFDYDPSTAGSSVRFDPPNANVRSITFHKPHPDPTLHQHILKEYRAKLESYYGWSPEVFKKAVEDLGGASSDRDD